MSEATWYRLEFDGTGERFVEIEMDVDELMEAISRSAVVRALRQVVAVPMRSEEGSVRVAFAPIDKMSPLVGGCHRDTEHVNLGRIVGFAKVDTTSEMWQAVRESALGEAAIIAPPKGIVTP